MESFRQADSETCDAVDAYCIYNAIGKIGTDYRLGCPTFPTFHPISMPQWCSTVKMGGYEKTLAWKPC